jgi:hypothetical protein
MAGINKIVNFNTVSLGFQNKLNIASILAKIVILAVILIEIIAPAIIVTNSVNEKYNRLSKLATYSLIGFTILATLMYHMPPTGNNYYAAMSNVTAVGGLLLLSQSL